MKTIIIILLLFVLGKLSYANDNAISLYELQSMKRNKATCNRLGNIYDACQWMMKFTLKNNSSSSLNSFCSIIKINKKKYEICSSKKFKKKPLKPNNRKVVLINLTELINYKNTYPKPLIKLIKIKGVFTKSNT